ncbi:MAG: alpha-L-fucosidase [Clostridia bacterium]|nr:alpha-L-fucosidase [Clostridia bacterium]
MRDYSYVYRFKDMALGMFVHFGLFTDIGRDCWHKLHYQVSDEKYEKLADTFKVDKGWAKNLVKVAKSAGARYITLTTRHHEGFSLYDTKGLSDFDVMHSPLVET